MTYALVASHEVRRSKKRMAKFEELHNRLRAEVGIALATKEIARAVDALTREQQILDQLERDIIIVMEKDPEMWAGRA